MAEIRPNRTKEKLAAGGVVTCIQGSPMSADMLDLIGPLGFDCVWLEAEHGDVDYGDIPNLSRACDLWGMTPLVRVNRIETGIIYRTLDVGAMGIIVPHVNTADEARTVVQAAKFHPLGHRGYFSSRQSYGVDGFVEKANDQSMVVIMLEDVVALDNLDEILAVDHIDVFFVAPGDLGQSMGTLDFYDPRVRDVVDETLKRIVAAGKIAGGVGDTARCKQYLDMGVQFLGTNWLPWLSTGANEFLGGVKG